MYTIIKNTSAIILKNLLDICKSAPDFLSFIYSIRVFWWGFGSHFLNMNFSVSFLNYLENPMISLSMFILGIIGLTGTCFKIYIYNLIFSLCNIFIFGIVAFSFLINDSQSVAFINYLIEMIGCVWLSIRIQNDNINKNKNININLKNLRIN